MVYVVSHLHFLEPLVNIDKFGRFGIKKNQLVMVKLAVYLAVRVNIGMKTKVIGETVMKSNPNSRTEMC